MASGEVGIRHHLLVYSTDPGWTYSNMNGFGPFIGPFVWFKLNWAAWALLLAVIANLFWVRGLIFYNTNILNAYRRPDEEGRPQAE